MEWHFPPSSKRAPAFSRAFSRVGSEPCTPSISTLSTLAISEIPHSSPSSDISPFYPNSSRIYFLLYLFSVVFEEEEINTYSISWTRHSQLNLQILLFRDAVSFAICEHWLFASSHPPPRSPGHLDAHVLDIVSPYTGYLLVLLS